MSAEETDDAFLGGRLRLWQRARGYRAGIDPILLAAAVTAKAGQTVLELGCGTGVVLLSLATRVPGLHLTGVELQPAYAELARRNAARNGIAAEIVEADLRALPSGLRALSFDHVVANPPYLDRSSGSAAADPGREAAFGESVPLADWIVAGMRRLRPQGRLTLIQRADRLPDLMSALGGRGVTVRPIAARIGRDADRVIVTAVKGGRAPFRIAASLIVHQGLRHERDGEDYTPAIRAVLRNAAPLDTTSD